MGLGETSVKKRTVLVTGGAGYLGSTLVPILLKSGYHVKIIDTFAFGESGLDGIRENPGLTVIRDDILSHENHPTLFEGVEAVIHLAGISNDPTSDLDPNLTVRTNYFATLSLARRAKTEGVRKFIFMSSCSVYGASGSDLLSEDSDTDPVTLYALTKLQCEPRLLGLNSSSFEVTILRLATLFGLSLRMRFDLAVNAMVKRALQGLDLVVHGDGLQYRPFLHVRDASMVILKTLQAEHGQAAGRILNVGNESLNYRIGALAEEIQRLFKGIKLSRLPGKVDARSYRVSFQALGRTLGYTPSITIEDAAREIREAFERGELKDLDDDQYYNLKVVKENAKHIEDFYSPASIATWTPMLPAPSSEIGAAKAPAKRMKVIGVILAHNCEKMLVRAYERIPKHLLQDVIVMDDGSTDDTSGTARRLGLKVFRHEPNRGYGGNLKAGLAKAIELGADFVVEIHGDGAQFDPISIHYALPYLQLGTDLVLGSRFQNPRKALANGMPLIRFVANHFLSFFDRWILKLPLTEFHTGFRIYSKKLIQTVPIQNNSDDYLFSFQIIAQAAYHGLKVAEVPVEADYRSQHTSHKLTGAVVYALRTFVELWNFVLAKRGWRYGRIYTKPRFDAGHSGSDEDQTRKAA
jgi:nucleoside-diphosphate-sugar epimerase